MSDLIPCPFCGGEAMRAINADKAKCSTAKCLLAKKWVPIAAWNTRHEEAARATPPYGWLPIESAPKDGTPVMLAIGSYPADVVIGWWNENICADNKPGAWMYRGWKLATPTHWMPTAPPPGDPAWRSEQNMVEFTDEVYREEIGDLKVERDALSDRVKALEAVIAAQKAEWGDGGNDRPLSIQDKIDAASPIINRKGDGCWKTYETALKMVGAKHSKYGLVDLVNYLLVTIKKWEAENKQLRQKALNPAQGGKV